MSRIVDRPSVNANPRTGPTARKYRISAAARVTVLPARLVRKALRNARRVAVRMVLPAATSSRMRSKNRMDESAVMPIDTMIPATPASVSANPAAPMAVITPITRTPKMRQRPDRDDAQPAVDADQVERRPAAGR